LPHRLLCVTAHPDDESGGFGGALLLAHNAGVETSVVCFTDGQAAHFRGGAAADEDLGRLRRAEMGAACAVLGVTRCERCWIFPMAGWRSRISRRWWGSWWSTSGGGGRKWC
jgi:LmbE family N-acetylglucosaminyl deacetylase